MRHPAYLKTGLSAALALLLSVPAFANPQGGKVVEGAATIVQETPTKLTINQHTNKAIIDWKSFSIGNGEHTQFKQPSSSSISLNRVTGNQVSKILGRLSANGQVFLINPNGVVFGPNSRIDVNGLMATTHDIKNKDFMAGRYNFNKPGKPNARIINQGRINVDDGGYVALIAPGIENSGYINAYLGRVDLASANGFTLSFGNNPLVSFLPDQKVLASIKTADGTPLSALIDNSGRIAANGGSVILSAYAVRKIAESTISNSGFIEAHSFGVKNGIISLFGDEGDVSITGTVDASGLQAGQTGGKIQVTGKNVGLYDGANVTASGDAGGGEILIGGDVRGQGRLPNAQGVYIAPTATISADAITQGNGGKVVGWSDNSSRIYGKLSARGGAQGGDGGFVETSSKNYLDVKGAPNVTAPKGKGGEWLLDPRNVTISTGATSGATSGAGTFTPTANNSIINKTDIETALNAGTSVTVTTGTTGAQAGTMAVTSSIAKSAGGDATLTLTSASDMTLSSSITSSAGKLNMDFRSTAGSIKLAATPSANNTAFTTNNGTLSLNAATNVELNKTRINTGSNDVTITAGVGVKVLQNNSINKARDVSITAGSYISNLGNGAAFADNNPDVKVDRNLTLTSPGTSLDFSGNGSGTLTYNFNGGSGAQWGRTRELNTMFGTVVIDSRNFTGTSLDFYQTSSNGNKIGFEVTSNTLRFGTSTLTTLEGQGTDANQIGMTNTNAPRQTTLYANNWTVDNTLINGPVHLSGYAANTWNTYSTYNSATKDTLFSAIKAGQLTPGSSNLGWRSLYQNGAATTAQGNAYTMWDSYDTFNSYSQQRLFEAIRDGEKTKVLNATLTPGTSELTWTALYVNGSATTTQTNAYTMWQSYLQYRYASAATLFNAIKSGTLTPNTSDIKWTALYVNGTATATQTQAYQMWLNHLNPPTSPPVTPAPVPDPTPTPDPAPVPTPEPPVEPAPSPDPVAPPVVGPIPTDPNPADPDMGAPINPGVAPGRAQESDKLEDVTIPQEPNFPPPDQKYVTPEALASNILRFGNNGRNLQNDPYWQAYPLEFRKKALMLALEKSVLNTNNKQFPVNSLPSLFFSAKDAAYFLLDSGITLESIATDPQWQKYSESFKQQVRDIIQETAISDISLYQQHYQDLNSSGGEVEDVTLRLTLELIPLLRAVKISRILGHLITSVVSNIRNLNFFYKIRNDVINKVPRSWGKSKRSNNIGGWRWFNKNGKNEVRVQRAKSKSNHPSQQVNYVIIKRGGKYVDKYGRPRKEGTHKQEPDIHVPLSQWQTWRSWFKP